MSQRIENLKLDLNIRKDTRGEAFVIEIGKDEHKDRGIAGELLNRIAARIKGSSDEQRAGAFAGFQLYVRPTMFGAAQIVLKGNNEYAANVADTPLGTIRSVEYAVHNFEERLNGWQRDLADAERNNRELETKIGQPFEHEIKLQSLAQRQQELENALDISKNQAANSLSAEESVEPETEKIHPAQKHSHRHSQKSSRKTACSH